MGLLELFEGCLNATYTHVENGGDYAIEREGEHLTVYFEHSSGGEDWFSNFDFPMKAYKTEGGTWFAHRGFLTVWQSILPYVKPHIMDKTVKRITLVGYSHGGAVCALCHEFVWTHRPDIRGALYGVGFGAPRVIWGRPKEADKRWEHFTVIRNYDDIVTHLPPAFLGYSHVGKLLTVGKEGAYSAVDAHRPENYRKELNNLPEISL